MLTLENQKNKLNKNGIYIYNKIHTNSYQVCLDIVKKTCDSYADIFYYSSSLVYRNIDNKNVFDLIEYKKLVDVIALEFRMYLFKL